MTFAECWEKIQQSEPGSYTDEKFVSKTLELFKGLQPLQPDERLCNQIDVSDGAPWAKLHTLLGLPAPPKTISTDEIAAVNYERLK